MDPNAQQSEQQVNPQQPVVQQMAPTVQDTSLSPKILLTIFGILVILGLIGGAYYLGTKNGIQSKTAIIPQPTTIPTVAPTISSTQTNGQNNNWVSYTNKTYQYSFMYPPYWTLDTSQAEPKTTASNLMTSASSITLTTPEGYQLRFVYNLYGVGGSGISFNKSKGITIDGKAFTKAYLNNCYGPGGPQANVTPVLDTCQNVFQEITYVPNANFSDKLAGTLFDINGKTASLTFTLFNGVGSTSIKDMPLDDASFQSVDSILDQVINSFKLPTQ